MEKNWNEKLTDLQSEVGYVQGPVNTVALLGLFGEAGEVLDEITFSGPPQLENLQSVATGVARLIDDYKKQVRDVKEYIRKDYEILCIPSEDKFDSELADAFYYLKALATNRGLTIEDLARMGYEKVVSKRLQKNISHAAVDPEEMRKPDLNSHPHHSID